MNFVPTIHNSFFTAPEHGPNVPSDVRRLKAFRDVERHEVEAMLSNAFIEYRDQNPTTIERVADRIRTFLGSVLINLGERLSPMETSQRAA